MCVCVCSVCVRGEGGGCARGVEFKAVPPINCKVPPINGCCALPASIYIKSDEKASVYTYQCVDPPPPPLQFFLWFVFCLLFLLHIASLGWSG